MKEQTPPNNLSRWLTRLHAMGFGVLLVLLIEGGFRIAGFGGDELGEDPFVGFSAVEPLFALNAITKRYELRPERGTYFVSDGFNRHKETDTLRIFVFGGSTVQGRPYSIQTAFPKWLHINLELAYPDKKFEVVNCGGISYASYRLVPILQECLNYEPDLFILCTGQNEFLEARSYGPIKALARPLGAPVKAIRTLATYQAMDSFYQRVAESAAKKETFKKPTLKTEVDAFLDYRRGLSAYHRDPKWREGVITHFEENIRRINTLLEGSKVPLIILNPPFNLKDCPPFKSEPSSQLNSHREQEIEEIMLNYQGQEKFNSFRAAHYLTQLSDAFDEQEASSHYTLGHCYLMLGDVGNAATHFNRALEEDICPLRILPEMRTFVETYATQQELPYLDLQDLLLQYSDSPIMGSEMLVDHIHPSIRGHQIIGEEVASLLFKTVLSPPTTGDWKSSRPEAYKKQFDSLDGLYYSHGQIRLDNLRDWTKGMTEGPPIEMHQPIESQ